jgi:hypothetical protein
MARKELIKAVAYLRTSSATNVSEDKDTLKRQREAVEGFARRTGFRSATGGYFPRLDPNALNRLKASRQPGEAYSDASVRLANEGAVATTLHHKRKRQRDNHSFV